ncbi:hypothetical protein [Lentisphaera araneosa]|nr:hypothetical protein [Lentisphaera araneosa]
MVQAQDNTLSYEITGLVDENALAGQGGAIFNTSTDIPGSGGSDNTLYMGNGSYVDFELSLENSVDPYAHLRVTVDDIIGSGSGGYGNLMLAQTSNSQGLTDTGTLSFLMTGNGYNSATLTLDWYTANGLFDTRLEEERFITSYDIDYNQYNNFFTDDLAGIGLSENTDLTLEYDNGLANVFSDGGSATMSDSEHAVAVLTNEISSQEIQVGKDGKGNVLFMFEFRNPSQNLDENFYPDDIEVVAPGAPTPPIFALMLFAAIVALKNKLMARTAKA